MTARTRPRALVVEDETVIRVLERDALLRAGFEVDEAKDGLEAVALIEDESRVYDVVVTDLGILGRRGEDVIARTVELRPGVPVIVCTGEPLDDAPPHTTLLAKPFRPNALAALAARLVAANAADLIG